MKRTVLFFMFLAIYLNSSHADPIDSVIAKKVAKNFYYQNSELKSLSEVNPKFVYASFSNDNMNSDNAIISYYVFNFANNNGFVIVAADNDVAPILGYSLTGSYSLANQPPAFIYWMKNYEKQILYIKQYNLKADKKTEDKWKSYLTDSSLKLKKAKSSVNSLLTTTWSQDCYYNALCPADSESSDGYCYHDPTGCTATAMAQIMKYWNYPPTGMGFNSYNSSKYGTLCANFGSTTYNWSNMPLTLNKGNNDVATLMYQCGVSMDMDYDPDGSGAWVIDAEDTVCAQNAYIKYFGYNSSTIQGLKRANYSDSAWISLLETELDNNRPIQYAGYYSERGKIGYGHSWVCDGYDSNDDFHMNWGWSGYFNGNFNLNSLTPYTFNFNTDQEAVIGIQPVTSQITTNLELYSDITVSPNPINFEDSLRVNADIYNAGSNTFTGDYAAALFDSSGVFVDYIQVCSNDSLQSGKHYSRGINFRSKGLSALPGNYIIGIYYRTKGGNWVLMNRGNYNNPINITIKGPYNNDITLYSKILPSPTTLIQGHAASVNANFVNNGISTFYGVYAAMLYDLSGNFVQMISIYADTNGLLSTKSYVSPLTFSTSSITAFPGTYLLAMVDSTKGNKGWSFVGETSSYSNPVSINVIAPSLTPDKYEPDNTEATAYNFPVSFNGDSAEVNTAGSNIYPTGDVDYYKIVLPPGYDYLISARVYDLGNKSNGQTYTMNVLFTYKYSSNWSDSLYDDSLPVNFQVNNGDTVYFKVLSFFSGDIGTYLLDVNITRKSDIHVDNIEKSDNSILVYPNPAQDYLNIKLTNLNNQKIELLLYNSLGELLYKREIFASNLLNIDISNYVNGIYHLEAIYNDKIYYKKFIINKLMN